MHVPRNVLPVTEMKWPNALGSAEYADCVAGLGTRIILSFSSPSFQVTLW